jgi:hypothetical protein
MWRVISSSVCHNIFQETVLHHLKEQGEFHMEAKRRHTWGKGLSTLKSQIRELIRAQRYDEDGPQILKLLQRLKVSYLL